MAKIFTLCNYKLNRMGKNSSVTLAFLFLMFLLPMKPHVYAILKRKESCWTQIFELKRGGKGGSRWLHREVKSSLVVAPCYGRVVGVCLLWIQACLSWDKSGFLWDHHLTFTPFLCHVFLSGWYLIPSFLLLYHNLSYSFSLWMFLMLLLCLNGDQRHLWQCQFIW